MRAVLLSPCMGAPVRGRKAKFPVFRDCLAHPVLQGLTQV